MYKLTHRKPRKSEDFLNIRKNKAKKDYKNEKKIS